MTKEETREKTTSSQILTKSENTDEVGYTPSPCKVCGTEGKNDNDSNINVSVDRRKILSRESGK